MRRCLNTPPPPLAHTNKQFCEMSRGFFFCVFAQLNLFCSLPHKGYLHEHSTLFNPLLNDKFLDWSKLKAFADDKINSTDKQKFFLALVENIVRKGENAGYQHFLLIPQCFQKFSFFRVIKSRDCVVTG